MYMLRKCPLKIPLFMLRKCPLNTPFYFRVICHVKKSICLTHHFIYTKKENKKVYQARISKELLLEGSDNEIIFTTLITPYIVSSLGSKVFVSVAGIEMAYGKKMTKTSLQKFKTTLNELCDEIVEKKGWIFEKSKYLYESNFIQYSFEEIQTIYQSGKLHLIPYYLRVIASVNWETNVGHMAQEFFCRNYNMNRVTISNYNKQLEKMNLLYIVHSKGIDGENNYYGRYEDKDLIDRVAFYKAKTDINNRRSLAMKYKQVVNGKIYSNDEMFVIAKYVINHNEYEKQIAKDGLCAAAYLDEKPLAEYIELLNSNL